MPNPKPLICSINPDRGQVSVVPTVFELRSMGSVANVNPQCLQSTCCYPKALTPETELNDATEANQLYSFGHYSIETRVFTSHLTRCCFCSLPVGILGPRYLAPTFSLMAHGCSHCKLGGGGKQHGRETIFDETIWKIAIGTNRLYRKVVQAGGK